jgi:hypothetical protein
MTSTANLFASRLPGASPLKRAAPRPQTPLLGALDERLADPGRQAEAAGVLAMRRLLTDPDRPMYARPSDPCCGQVYRALRAALLELESR